MGTEDIPFADSSDTVTREAYSVYALRNLGLPHPMRRRHLGARNGLVVWMHGETGEHPGLCNGVKGEGARNNPLNTTLALPGSTNYNTVSANVHVKNYLSAEQGALAVAHTLLFTDGQGYEGIVAALRKPYVKVETVLAAIAQSNWGTSGNLLAASLQAFRWHGMQDFYRNYPVGP